MIDIEDIGQKFSDIVSSNEWKDFQEKFNSCNEIYVLGHGGNLAVADHTAVDITRLSNGQKNALCPSSAVVATSYINDSNFEQWMVNWLMSVTSTRNKDQLKNSLVYGISSSGNSKDVIRALQWADANGLKTALVTGREIDEKLENCSIVHLDTKFYHTCEVLTLLLQYQLTHGSGKECPPIGSNRPEDLKKLNWRSQKIRKHSYPDEMINVGVDFDKVIHKCSKGYHDGTIYDDPVEGVKEALKELSKEHTVIVYTCKSRSDRGLVNGKTGTKLVWEWLEKHNLSEYVSKVTAEKPRAIAYIDDKAIRFSSWEKALKDLEGIKEEK